MSQTARKAVLALCLIFISPHLGVTYSQAQLDDPIGRLLSQLESHESKERSKAFYDVLSLKRPGELRDQTARIPSLLSSLLKSFPERADEVKVALINLLAQENSVVQRQNWDYQRTGRLLSEEYVNYYGDLIAAVASLRDKRAVDALLGAMETGNMATSALAGFGRIALEPVIARLASRNAQTRQAAARVISQMLDPDNMQQVSDPTSRMKIKNALVRTASDEDPFVRMGAIEGLAKLRDPSVKPLIEKLAKEDPYEASMHGGKKGVYPVREAARKALRNQE